MSKRGIKRSQKLKHYANRNKRRDVFFESIFRKACFERKYFYQRQKVISNFIVDFVFPTRNLIVEIDEQHHLEPGNKRYDIYREKKLKQFGFNILRFTDWEVLNELEDCVNCIDDFEASMDIRNQYRINMAKANGGESWRRTRKRTSRSKTKSFSCAERYSKFKNNKKLYSLPK